MKHLNYLPEKMGKVCMTPSGPFVAGSVTTLELVYSAGFFGIDDGGIIKVSWRVTSDMGKPQFLDAGAPNYTSVCTTGNCRVESWVDRSNIRPWTNTMQVRVCDGFLVEGDEVVIRMGDPSGGAPGLRMQSHAEEGFQFRVFVDPFATYEFNEVPNPPAFDLHPGVSKSFRIVAPSVVKLNNPFQVAIVAEDEMGNVSRELPPGLLLSAEPSVSVNIEAPAVKKLKNPAVIQKLMAEAPGNFRLLLTDEAGREAGRSNPIRAVENPEVYRFWGDLHGQTGETTGVSTIRDYFRFARDFAFLDIASHQANDFQLKDDDWHELNLTTAAMNEDGAFIAIPGYEWSGNTGVGGDRNVFYFEEWRPLGRSSRALTADQSDQYSEHPTAKALFDFLRQENAVVIAHAGGRPADIRKYHDPKVERSVEVHASWGTFEWLLHDAFEAGHRVGVVCNGDDHKGRPGATGPGYSSNVTAIGGLTCFLLPELSRSAVATALKNRRHYGTTGTRIFLNVEGKFEEPVPLHDPDPSNLKSLSATRRVMMGDIVAPQGSTMTLAVDVTGTAPLERVEVFNGQTRFFTKRTFESREIGRRIRVLCEGARYRGRLGAVAWKGTAKLKGARFTKLNPVNFVSSLSRLETLQANKRWQWTARTRGNSVGFDMHLDHLDGTLELRTEPVSMDVDLASLNDQDIIKPGNGIGVQIRVFRLPDTLSEHELRFCFPIRYGGPDDWPIYVKVTQEDGHQAWSSPIYLIPHPEKIGGI